MIYTTEPQTFRRLTNARAIKRDPTTKPVYAERRTEYVAVHIDACPKVRSVRRCEPVEWYDAWPCHCIPLDQLPTIPGPLARAADRLTRRTPCP